jgi:hypothetical protein
MYFLFTFLDVSLRVAESWGLTSFSSNETMQVGSYFVGTTSFNGMALGTFHYEDLQVKIKL